MGSQTWKFKLSRFKPGTSTCHYCEKIISEDECEIEHKTPVSRGGSSRISNLVLSCRPCNRAKANLTEQEFYSHIIRMAEIFKRRQANGEEIF